MHRYEYTLFYSYCGHYLVVQVDDVAVYQPKPQLQPYIPTLYPYNPNQPYTPPPNPNQADDLAVWARWRSQSPPTDETAPPTHPRELRACRPRSGWARGPDENEKNLLRLFLARS